MDNLIKIEVKQIVDNNSQFAVNNNDDLSRATIVLRNIKAMQKKVKEQLDPMVDQAYKAHKEATALRKKFMQPLEDVETKINISIKNFHLQEEAKAVEIKRKLDEEFAKKVADEKAELSKQAENSNEWDKEVIQEKIESIKPIELNVAEFKNVDKQDGQYKRSNWKAKIVNPDLVPDCYWIIDEKALDIIAKKEKGQFKIDGVEFYDDFTIVTKI